MVILITGKRWGSINTKPKNVIVISDVKSNYIEQAIFILKSNEREKFSNDYLLNEANNLINSYDARLLATRQPGKKNKLKNILLMCIPIGIAVISILLVYISTK